MNKLVAKKFLFFTIHKGGGVGGISTKFRKEGGGRTCLISEFHVDFEQPLSRRWRETKVEALYLPTCWAIRSTSGLEHVAKELGHIPPKFFAETKAVPGEPRGRRYKGSGVQLIDSWGSVQVKSGAFTHFGCDDAACFPVHNCRMLYTQMKAQCIR